ncbi:MAG: transglutaminase domain-containing protein, partial [Anaerolineae bacterium]|nr:transglutaminase domain-containing protein [Anaerolineae bacterium]
WRGTTYARFDGTRWFNGPDLVVDVAPYEPVMPSFVFTPTRPLEQHYLIHLPHGTTLYAVGEPQFVDQAVQSRQRNSADLIALQGASSDYVVFSQVPVASEEQLNAAPETDPEQIAETYLPLPANVPERVLRLANQVIQGTATAYDKARAIEAYLRHFPYDLQIPSPPAGRDAVDYFLFELQRGYCDYYASSFVVLARAAGLPSRLAVGYAMGSYAPENGCYTVTELDAHSWPEVYFPKHGWIPFEPTASLSRFERPVGSGVPLEQAPEAGVMALPKRTWAVAVRAWWDRKRDDWRLYFALTIGLIVSVLLARWWWAWRRVRRLDSRQGIALAYEQMTRAGSWLARVRHPHETPAEYGAYLAQAIDARAVRWPRDQKSRLALIAQVKQGVTILSEAYVRASYSARAIGPPDRRRIEGQWRRLRWQMWWLSLISRRNERPNSRQK